MMKSFVSLHFSISHIIHSYRRVPYGHFVLHFCSSLVSLLSLGVNLLGHNGNSQDGRMKVLRETQQIPKDK